MKIKISNTEKLNIALDKIQQRSRVRTIDTVDLARCIVSLEEHLETKMYKKDWIGLKFILDPFAQTFPSAYKGAPMSTYALIERFPSGWFITNMDRAGCSTQSIQPVNIHEFGDALIKHASAVTTWN